MKINWKIAATAVLSAAGGAAVSYVITKKKLEEIWAQRVQDEVEFAKDFYKKVYKVGEFETPESAAAAVLPEGMTVEADRARRALTIYQKGTDEDMAALKGQIVRGPYHPQVPPSNAFEKRVTPEDLGEETLAHDPAKPYRISAADFIGGGEEYPQFSYTWYAGDEVLADENDAKIENYEDVVGVRPIKNWDGTDPLYVRNETRMEEYEIVFSNGRYDVEVLGHQFEPE